MASDDVLDRDEVKQKVRRLHHGGGIRLHAALLAHDAALRARVEELEEALGVDYTSRHRRDAAPDTEGREERCICVDPSEDIPGDTGRVMECPVHGEVRVGEIKSQHSGACSCPLCVPDKPMSRAHPEEAGGEGEREREAKISLDGFQQDPLDALDLVAECAAHTQMEAAASSVAVVRVIRDRLADALAPEREQEPDQGEPEHVANLGSIDLYRCGERVLVSVDGNVRTNVSRLTFLALADRLRGAPEGAGSCLDKLDLDRLGDHTLYPSGIDTPDGGWVDVQELRDLRDSLRTGREE